MDFLLLACLESVRTSRVSLSSTQQLDAVQENVVDGIAMRTWPSDFVPAMEGCLIRVSWQVSYPVGTDLRLGNPLPIIAGCPVASSLVSC